MLSVQRRSNATTDRIGRASQWIGIEVRITLRGRRLRVAEQLANDREVEAATGAEARIGVVRPLQPRKRTSLNRSGTSAKCRSQTW